MAKEKVTLYAEMLEKAQMETLAAMARVPEGKRLYQFAPGKATPLWLVGHLANTINNVVVRWMFAGESLLPKETMRVFAPGFAGGIAPSSDAAQYPTWEETRKIYDDVLTHGIQLVSGLDDEDLPKPLKAEMPELLREFFATHALTLNQMVSHDAYHRGQIGLIASLP